MYNKSCFGFAKSSVQKDNYPGAPTSTSLITGLIFNAANYGEVYFIPPSRIYSYNLIQYVVDNYQGVYIGTSLIITKNKLLV